jgi:magnesium chelatase subunit D
MVGEVRGATGGPDPARRFPFSAVLGQDEARLALLLGAIDPAIGGVLLRGDRGSARSTLGRGLAGLLPGGTRFVEVPLGATEDRVLGSLDVVGSRTDGETQFSAGLLASAHGGVLYVDAVNLLPDHLVDVLFDVAASGVNRVERHGAWHEHPARFVLVGSMNPDDGELRTQILDRFGLAVEVKAPGDAATRAEVVRRRLTHDSGGIVDGYDGDIVLRARLAAAMPADLPTSVVDFACHLAAGVGAEGLRGDLSLCRAAAAFAGWQGRSITTESDVERVAPLALGHRRRRRPFDPPTLAPGELERALVAARQAFEAESKAAEVVDITEAADDRSPRTEPDEESGVPSGYWAATLHHRVEEEATGAEPPGDTTQSGETASTEPAPATAGADEAEVTEPAAAPGPSNEAEPTEPAAEPS